MTSVTRRVSVEVTSESATSESATTLQQTTIMQTTKKTIVKTTTPSGEVMTKSSVSVAEMIVQSTKKPHVTNLNFSASEGKGRLYVYFYVFL